MFAILYRSTLQYVRPGVGLTDSAWPFRTYDQAEEVLKKLGNEDNLYIIIELG
jgi:hypothetical protein